MLKQYKGIQLCQLLTSPRYAAFVFPESGDFMVCTPGEDGGTVPYFDGLYPDFDYEHEDGSMHWCVRHTLLGGDSVPICEITDGCAQDMLTGLEVDGRVLSEAQADSMDFELRGYLAALFSASPIMQAFIRDKVATLPGAVGEEAKTILADIYRRART